MRPDGGVRIGLGHIRRSHSLAEAFADLGAEVRMLIDDRVPDTALPASSAAVSWHRLDPCTHPTAWAVHDAESALQAVEAWHPTHVVVDHYSLPAQWYEQVRARTGAKVAAVDDLGDRSLPVDWLIDHNPCADPRAKYRDRVPSTAVLLCGPRFALVGARYARAHRREHSNTVHSIGISLGGVDASGLSEVVVDACREVARFAGLIEIVTSSANPHLERLVRLTQGRRGVSLTIDAPDLVDFLSRHELFVGAGGGSAWERCCMGAPAVVLAVADNQRAVVADLERLGVASGPNPANALDPQAIGRAVATLVGDPDRRRRFSERGRALVDGLGAVRVAVALAADHLQVRPATIADAALLHAWRNAPDTRSVSGDGREIPFAEHRAWMSAVLADEDRMLLVGQVGTRPVGSVRFDRDQTGEATVSIYLAPDLHGLGLAGRLLRAGERAATKAGLAVRGFCANVLPSNRASRRLFEAAGYSLIGNVGALERWRRNP